MRDVDQIRVWQASLALSDGRMYWPRALRKAINMILERELEKAGMIMLFEQILLLPAPAIRPALQKAIEDWRKL